MQGIVAGDELVAQFDELQRWAEEDDVLDAEEWEQLQALRALDAEISLQDISYMYLDRHLEDFARERTKELYNVALDAWPFTAIDWDMAVQDFVVGLTEISFRGETYWVEWY